jgi:dihydropyrimidinase
VVIYDPNGRTRISVETHHMNMDYSAWEGWEIAGKVDTVISRGDVISAGGEYAGHAGHGRFLSRGLSEYLV